MNMLFHRIISRSLFSLILLIIISSLLFFWLIQKLEKQMLDNSLHKVENIADSKVSALDEYYKSLNVALSGLEALILHDLGHHDVVHAYSSAGYRNNLDQSLRKFIELNGIYDVYIIGLDGKVNYTYKKANDLRTNILKGPLNKTSLREAFTNALDGRNILSTFSYYPPIKHETAFLAKKVKLNGIPICVVAVQIDVKKINSILNDYSSLGETGEVVAGAHKDQTLTYLNPLRFGEKAFSNQKLDTSSPIGKAVNGRSGSGYLLDRRGVEVGAVWHYLPKFGWGLVVKIDKSELMQEWTIQKYQIIGAVAISSFFFLFIFWYMYHLLISPLQKLTSFARAMANGEYGKKIDYPKNDEFSQLIETFETMADHIRQNLSKFQVQNFMLEQQKEQIESLNKNLEIEVDEKTKKLKEYIHIVDQNVITSTTNKHGIITNVSDAFCAISGYSRQELLGANHNIIRHPEIDDDFFKHLWNSISNGKTWKGIIKNRNKKGEAYWVNVVITPNFFHDNIIGYTGISHDITAQKINELLVITDPLTGLFNRRHFNEMVEKEIQRARRSKIPVSLLMMDVDFFKKYNDHYGHMKGDNVLVKVASIIDQHALRASDYAFRLGGEEFGLLLASMDSEGAIILAERIRSAIEAESIEHVKNLTNPIVTISIGLISMIPDENTSLNTLYKLADEQLYVAKEKGRNRISY